MLAAALFPHTFLLRLPTVQNAEGSALGPFDCWLLVRGLKTMGLRMERQVGAHALLGGCGGVHMLAGGASRATWHAGAVGNSRCTHDPAPHHVKMHPLSML